MDRTSYRLSLSALSALAALMGPVIFLEDRFRLGYLLGGLAAALLTWLFLTVAIAMEPYLPPVVLAIIGAGSAVFSWMTISLVTVFDIIPHILREGLALFDPVWILGGLAPLVILAAGLWRGLRENTGVLPSLASALHRFSLPLLGTQISVGLLDLPKQYRWLFLFTGVMFLVLDELGIGVTRRAAVQPLAAAPRDKAT